MNKNVLKRIILTSVISVLGISTSFGAFTFDKQEEPDNAPVVGLYRFIVPEELQASYNSVGVFNLTSSMEKEPNTLSMNVAHVENNPSESYVMEVYKNGEALETHRKSEHFNTYLSEVGSKLTNRRLYDVQPLLLLEKQDALSAINDGQSVVTLTEVSVDKNELDTVQRQYQLDIERAIRDDAGYKAGYVLRDRNARNHWYIVQIYSDEAAFKKHMASPGYRFMMSQIQSSLQNVSTKVLQGDILVNHGGQSFVRQ